jgi:hypothetical protein
VKAWTCLFAVVVLLAPMRGGLLGAQALRAGEVAFVDGDVTVDGKEARIGQAIRRGSTVSTGPASSCEITWGTDNIIQIQEKTLAVIDVGGPTPGMRLRSGSVAAVLNRVEVITRRGTFRVKTPAAVASVRGTVFFVKVEDAANTYVCACYGELGVVAGLGGPVDLAATRHMPRRFTRAGLTSRAAPAGLLYHDDRSMNELARKIGYTVPWGQGSYGTTGSGGYGY